MTCKTCGAAVSLEDSTKYEGEGRFKEEYECINGHVGYIRGEESNPPSSWTKTGMVFRE